MKNAKKIIAALAVCAATSSVAHADWTANDTKLEIAYQTIALIDLGQTQWMRQQNEKSFFPKYEETNPILGPHPSRGQINRYFAVSSALHLAVSYFIPDEYRPYWQWITIGIEGGVVAQNMSMGIGVNLKY